MLKIWSLLVSACLALSVHAASALPLRIGILPTLGTKALLTIYLPLRSYLEQTLQQPVELITAPDFKRFHQDTLAGEFDLLVTAPHLARLAQLEANLLPVAIFITANRPILVMAKNQPVTRIDQLRGRTLAIFDPLALVVMQAQHWLEDQGLKAGRDYQLLTFPSQTSAIYSVQRGESLLGVSAPSGIRQMSPETSEQIQIYNELPQVPSLIWMIHPRLTAQKERIQTALLRFSGTPAGEQFLAATAYKGIRQVEAEELRKLDRAAREVDKLLKALP